LFKQPKIIISFEDGLDGYNNEKLEDDLARFLAGKRLHGKLKNKATGNEVAFPSEIDELEAHVAMFLNDNMHKLGLKPSYPKTSSAYRQITVGDIDTQEGDDGKDYLVVKAWHVEGIDDMGGGSSEEHDTVLEIYLRVLEAGIGTGFEIIDEAEALELGIL